MDSGFTEETNFKKVKKTLSGAQEHTSELATLSDELSKTRGIKSEASILDSFEQCNIRGITAALETAASSATIEMKEEWTTLRKAHETVINTLAKCFATFLIIQIPLR